MDFFKELVINRMKLEQIQENSARLAKSTGTFTTVGPGTFAAGKPFMFDLSFLNEPSFSAGSAIDTDDGSDLIAGDFPVANGMAYDWILSPQGYYIGAHIFMVVASVSSYTIHHHFTFEGNALKYWHIDPGDLDF